VNPLKTEKTTIHLSELHAFNEEEYTDEYSLSLAKEMLEKEQENSPFSHLTFEEDTWELYVESQGNSRKIKFEEVAQLVRFHPQFDETKFVLIVKCWVASLIHQFSINYADSMYRYLVQFLDLSTMLDPTSIKEVEFILTKKTSKRIQYDMALSTLNFIEYYPFLDKESRYGPLLFDIKEANFVSKRDDAQRDLPPTKEVHLFHWIMRDYFKGLDRNSEEYLLYFPIYLWWNLTMLIPLRPCEFCTIKRNALIEEKDHHYYIKLPREKQPKNRVQVVDKIKIPFHMANEILHYQNRISDFYPVDTLLHPSLVKTKKDKSSYTTTRHHYLLRLFYRDVVGGKYGLTMLLDKKKNVPVPDTREKPLVDITKPIATGDTRHFSMLNLMRQGYHPLEIARLAGHTSIYSQQGYYSHLEYWVDTEVLQLMERLSADLESSDTVDFDDDDFKTQFIFKPGTSLDKIPLDLGYCTDPAQNCPVEDHFACPHYRLTEYEYMNRQAEIEEAYKRSNTHIKHLLSVLTNLQKIAQKHSDKDYEFSDNDVLYNKDLIEIKKQLDVALHWHSRVQHHFTHSKKYKKKR